MQMTKKVTHGGTTKKQFEVFKKEAEKWVDYFGLSGWEINFGHENIDNEACSNLEIRITHRLAVIILEKSWSNNDAVKPTVYNLKKSAFHEVCELLLARIRCKMLDQNIDNDEVEELMHEMITRLENSLFKASMEKKA
jgi:hypothetical protein